MKKITNKKRIITALLVLLLMASFLTYISFVNQRVEHLINSDDASELIYGRLLSSENGFISKNWFFSTELRVLHNQPIYSILFKLTNNWHAVRIISYIIIYVLLLFSYYLLCRKLNLHHMFFLGGLLLVIPFSTSYFEYMLLVPYYNSYIFISFITLFLCFCYFDNKNLICLIFSIILAVFAGMGGMRQTTNLYLPLFLSGLIALFVDQKNDLKDLRKSCNLALIPFKDLFCCAKKSRFYNIWIFSFVSLFASCVGILINSLILSKIFHFLSFSNFTFVNFSLSKLSEVLSSIICSFGYVAEKSVFSLASVYNVFCFVWMLLSIVSIVYALKMKSSVSSALYLMALLITIAFGIYIGMATFTELLPLERYSIPLVVLTFPLVSLFLSEYQWKYLSKAICIVLIFLLSFTNILRYRSWKDADTTSELKSISDILIDDGYLNGYATFWNANITTELSNGLIDVWCFGNKNLEIYHWLQLVSHTTTYPDGKTFLLLSSDELSSFEFDDKLHDNNQIYKSDDYLVYGYNDYQSLFDELKISH